MTRLSDTQRIILAAAAQRDDASLLPLPASITPGGGAKALNALNALIARSFADERESASAAVHRKDGDRRFGLFLTAAGAAAISVELETSKPDTAVHADSVTTSAASTAKAASKAAQMLGLLNRNGGATLAELIALTGWLPHTTRAALTGLRKKGHDVVRSKRDGATCYCIVSAA